MTSASALALVPPGLILILGAIVLPFLSRRERPFLVLGLPLLVLWLIWQLPDGPSLTMRFLEWDVVLIEADGLSRLFATIFAIMSCSRSTRNGRRSWWPRSSTPAAPSA